MNLAAELIDAVEATAGSRIATADMITVIGKLFARGEAGRFADDLVAFDDQAGAVVVLYHPFSTEQSNGVFGAVENCDEINERVRLVRGQACAAVMIGELVEAGGETRKSE